MSRIKTPVAFAATAFAAAAMAAAAPLTSDQFAPGWQDHAQGLINRGAALRDLSKTSWMVPSILAPGRYVLVNRHGDKAEVIDGYDLTVKAGEASQQINVVVPMGYGDVVAVPIADVPALASRREPSGSR